MIHYSTIDLNGNEVVGNLSDECRKCMSKCQSVGKIADECKLYFTKRRNGIIKNKRGVTFLCCGKTKTTKLFRGKLEILAHAYHDLLVPLGDAETKLKENEQKRVNRLVHNLTSINAHNIQEIYDLVPQEILTSDLQSQLKHIQEEIKNKPKEAALMFLRISKHNIHMKSEFSIYKKLDRSNPTMDVRNHPIKKVILNVLHTFFIDFSDKDVFVKVENYNGKVRFDYETVQVALYHLLDNASKYVRVKSRFDISFKEFNEELEVVFDMISLRIEDDEVENIFKEGYSGRNAKKTQKHGEGIGLWRIHQMLDLNDIKIEMRRSDEIENVMGFEFCRNKFILRFKR